MKISFNNSWRLFALALGLALSLVANHARAAVYYWDPNGTTSIGGNGTWDTTTKQWSTTSTQSAAASLVVWNTASAADFCAGPASGTSQGTFTITVNSAITMAGIFNGNLNPGPSVVTFNGPGSFVIASGINAAFSTGG